MSVDDARCRGCGAIPERVFGAWFPHEPSAPCADLPLSDWPIDAAHTCAVCNRPLAGHTEAELDDCVRQRQPTCGDGLHVFPDLAKSGACQCGRDYLGVAPPPVTLTPPWYLKP